MKSEQLKMGNWDFGTIGSAIAALLLKKEGIEYIEELDKLARTNEVSVLYTGATPHYLLDYPTLALNGPCKTVEFLSAYRINDHSSFGRTAMCEQHVDLLKEKSTTVKPSYLSSIPQKGVGLPDGKRLIEMDHVRQLFLGKENVSLDIFLQIKRTPVHSR